ncbi:MAG TPA: tetratricopeptide repeat protein, partial [Pyrinomonadaceae bacterium]|nr:tetratricopeptide repeat protein [Pyrinomonadaceae bacterium]
KALSQSASRLREKLGESLQSIQKFDAPLEATTSSLEALKAYALGRLLYDSGKWSDANLYFNRAVEIDPNFALAYRTLAFSYSNMRRSELIVQYAEKAYALRDRVSEREKLAILDAYYLFVTGEVDKRIDEAELRKRLFPQDSSAFSNLSLAYGQIGQFEKSITESREALRLNPNSITPYVQLGHMLISLDRYAEAGEIYRRALQQNLDVPSLHGGLYQIAFVAGDTGAMQQQIDWAKGKPHEYEALDWQTGAAAFAGQRRRAQDLSRRSIELARSSDEKEMTAGYTAEAALRDALFGECAQTRAAATQALAPKYFQLFTARAALALALCDEESQAQRLADDLVKDYPKNTRVNSIWVPPIRAAIELRRGRAQQAVNLLEDAKRYEAAAQFWPQYLRGLAYLKLRLGAEAAREFQKILDHRGEALLSALYPLARLGLARAAVMNGDAAKARPAYQDFFALWKEADADLPVLVEAKKEYERLK